jgi:hypothetical protein
LQHGIAFAILNEHSYVFAEFLHSIHRPRTG